MSKQADTRTRWKDLERLLEQDPTLAKVLRTLDLTPRLSRAERSNRRQRIPYTGASSVDNRAEWDRS